MPSPTARRYRPGVRVRIVGRSPLCGQHATVDMTAPDWVFVVTDNTSPVGPVLPSRLFFDKTELRLL